MEADELKKKLQDALDSIDLVVKGQKKEMTEEQKEAERIREERLELISECKSFWASPAGKEAIKKALIEQHGTRNQKTESTFQQK